MNWKAIFGLGSVVALLGWGMLLGGDLFLFVDPVTQLMVVGVTLGLLLLTHGLEATVGSLVGGMGRLLYPRYFTVWTSEEAQRAGRVASSAVRFSLVACTLGGVIGLVAMLRLLEEPARIGDAMAVMMNAGFHALILVGMWFLPIARRFGSAGGSAE